MRISYSKGGYSAELASRSIPNNQATSLSEEVETRYKWENDKPTKEVTGYRALFAIPGDWFYVKFEKEVKLPKYKSEVQFENLQACEVQGNLYFKADGIKEV